MKFDLKQRKPDETIVSLLMCHRVIELEMNFLVSLCANQYADVTNEHKCMILTVIQKIFQQCRWRNIEKENGQMREDIRNFETKKKKKYVQSLGLGTELCNLPRMNTDML